ncbi:head-tail adaptor protein [Alkalihalophilus lindianensis]|uniref:Head-tail adaptor protein n=1 Tax=Alkalihalophilus lindianensis TaxID=1630542 RepID=A0ABU3X7J5_9BACI|nr:head-tail adaptor protein [Alkalihalophilus lindianensis]MDV2683805.1 head-tail adaptor protein [Alkalihalophilus lindianensis]MDV2683871.1 head-tail adaptor protein [Alkalihalophilus lindianensis]
MNPSKYRNRIAIGSFENFRNPVTKIVQKKFSTFYECWSAVVEPTNWQSFKVAVERAEARIFFEIRYVEGIKPGMLVSFKDKHFEIEEVKPDFQYKRETVLQCKGVVINES